MSSKKLNPISDDTKTNLSESALYRPLFADPHFSTHKHHLSSV